MSKNNADLENAYDNVESARLGNDNATLLGLGLAFVVTFFTGLFIGKHGKKKAVDEAYEKGMADAAEVFEKKFRLQHEAFTKKEKKWEEHEAEYQSLLDAYENRVAELELENDKPDVEGQIFYFKKKIEELESIKESC